MAAAVLFFPALIATYANTEEAITAAKERRENMVKLATAKHCTQAQLDAGANPVVAVTPSVTVPAAAPAPVAVSTAPAMASPSATKKTDIANFDAVVRNMTNLKGCPKESVTKIESAKLISPDSIGVTKGIKVLVTPGAGVFGPFKEMPTDVQLASLKGKAYCRLTS